MNTEPNQADKAYIRLLKAGFMSLRQAIDLGDLPWANAETEMLHNIPSLIGEKNLKRHIYYFQQERVAYMEWLTAAKHEAARERMMILYKPCWNELERLVRPEQT